jgi:hypothetical protein
LQGLCFFPEVQLKKEHTMQDGISFPQYRKYKNNKNFFRIINAEEFEEISFIGSRKIVVAHKAKILPDRNLILDLLHDPAFAQQITEEEYHQQLNA